MGSSSPPHLCVSRSAYFSSPQPLTHLHGAGTGHQREEVVVSGHGAVLNTLQEQVAHVSTAAFKAESHTMLGLSALRSREDHGTGGVHWHDLLLAHLDDSHEVVLRARTETGPVSGLGRARGSGFGPGLPVSPP